MRNIAHVCGAILVAVTIAGTPQALATAVTASPVLAASPGERGGEALVGIVYPWRALDIVSEVSGLVESIGAQLGERVDEGDILARLATRWIEHDLHIARADVASAEAEVAMAILERDLAVERRQRREQAPDAWTGEETATVRFEAASAEVKVTLAEARLARDRAHAALLADRLEQTRIRAPFAGVITGRFVEAGDLVTPNSPVMRLTTDDSLYVRFGVPEDRIHLFEVGMTLDVEFAPLDGAVAMSLSRLAPEIDPATGMALAEGPLRVPPALKGRILSGMTARVKLEH